MNSQIKNVRSYYKYSLRDKVEVTTNKEIVFKGFNIEDKKRLIELSQKDAERGFSIIFE